MIAFLKRAVVIHLIVAQTLHQIDGLRAAWEWLYRQQRDATFFQSFRWNRMAAQCFLFEQPYVVFVESDSGAALIPAAVRRNSELRLLGEELFDYRDVLHAGNSSLLTYAWSHLAGIGLPLSATPLRGGPGLRHWDGFEVSDFCNAPYVAGEIGAAEFASSHPRAARQLRRLARAGVTLGHYSGDSTSLLREIYFLKGALTNSRGKSLFADFRRVNFMLAAGRSAPEQCQIFTLESGTTLVAALVTFRESNVRRFYTTYFDPAWARYSPGLALLFEATRLSLDEGLLCDYMTGEQDYKLRLATGSIQLYHAQGKFCRDNPCDREASLVSASSRKMDLPGVDHGGNLLVPPSLR